MKIKTRNNSVLRYFSRCTYENIINFGEFNMAVQNPQLNGSMQLHDMSNLMNEQTCYQSHDPTCIGNILTNQKAMFKTAKTFESGLSDHYKLVLTIMKSASLLRKKIYSTYKKFVLKCFNIMLKTKLDSIKGPTYIEFDEAFCSIVNIYAPLKVKILALL